MPELIGMMILLDRIVITYDGLLVIGGPYIISTFEARMFGLPEVHTRAHAHSHTPESNR